MRETTTTDLGRFGHREIEILSKILNEWVANGLPDDFANKDVKPMMNMNSGNVFLTNEEFEVAMMNGDKLESFYTSPYEGKKGFFDDLLPEYKEMHSEDQSWFRNIAESIRREDELPKTWAADQFRYIINLDERGEFSADFYRIDVETGEDEAESYQHIDTSDAEQLGEEGVDYRDGMEVMTYYNELNPDSAVEVHAVLDQDDEAETED